ncbi:hypothetical protein [Nakamurella sp. PAMC28650]|uniref:hypothetical protein n=1 Tax=Nakamurella sp. PAMC28650 TaxID=2762325 RepID=UPI00164E4FC8|nr:hypothetical protein [Nakamurella sp. PAMC28650]QNK80384.1 hypothetical protein H7F38_19640 [Nakamurella sp. PAMC28650]
MGDPPVALVHLTQEGRQAIRTAERWFVRAHDLYPAEQRALEFGGTVVRVPGEQIEFEVDSARAAAELAATAARKARRERKSEDFKAGMHRLFHHDHDKADA